MGTRDQSEQAESVRRVAVVGGNGKSGRAVTAALARRGAQGTNLGRAEWPRLAEAMVGCEAVYLIAPNLHADEPGYVRVVLEAMRRAGVPRVVYHSVASPYVPEMPHHLGKARGEAAVRRSGLSWTVLQPGAYLQNLDLTGPVRVPYDVAAPFGFLDLADLGEAAATVLLEAGHDGATYELASRQASVAALAREAGTTAVRDTSLVPSVPGDREASWLRAMFDYYDRHGLLVGLLPLRALLGDGGGEDR